MSTAAALVAGQIGFEPMPQPMGTDWRTVLIYAPLNCPSATSERARELSRKLSVGHIPHVQLEEARFDMVNPDQPTVNTFNRVMNGTGPVVFVRGRGKANPAFEEVLAEYVGGRKKWLSENGTKDVKSHRTAARNRNAVAH